MNHMNDDTVDLKITNDMRGILNKIEEALSEYASVLDKVHHHIEDKVMPELPDQKIHRKAVQLALVEISANPLELHYVKRICDILGIDIEEYLQYRDLLVRMDEIPKGKRGL